MNEKERCFWLKRTITWNTLSRSALEIVVTFESMQIPVLPLQITTYF